MVELEEMRALTIENLYNLNAYQIIEISLVLHSTHILPRNQDKFVVYVNNNIN